MVHNGILMEIIISVIVSIGLLYFVVFYQGTYY